MATNPDLVEAKYVSRKEKKIGFSESKFERQVKPTHTYTATYIHVCATHPHTYTHSHNCNLSIRRQP